ncbi:patatin-like phospholipase family protein [Sphingopyxis sp. SE2]|nr:patatin-like phospholipase family protein [Sphingopyxis sp. SE2]
MPSRSVLTHRDPSPVGLLLCGGGSRGAMEVGFYRALTEFGVRPDFILGSSIGALNGAYIAGGMAPSELVALWRAFRRRRALALNWAWLFHPRRRPGFLSLAPLRNWLRRTLPVTRFEDLAIPLTVVTTDLEAGRACYWHGQGDLVEPVIASMSLPGIFPPVELDGRLHVDGGITNNAPLDKAHELGARSVYMIECMCAERCPTPLRGWADIVMRSFSIALDSKYRAELKHFHRHIEVHSIRPDLREEVDVLDFRHTEYLIEAAYRQTRARLAARAEPGMS